MYSTDNGPHYNSWPDAAITPFRSEKNSNWEGAYRVPAFLRWPAKWQAGVTLNGIVAHQDMLTTFLAAAGEPDVAAKCRAGHEAGGKTFKVILDGKDMNAYLAGETDREPARPLLLRQRRSRARGPPGRRLEVHLPGAAGAPARAAGSSPSSSCAPRRSSTCGATRSSALSRTRTPTTTG